MGLIDDTDAETKKSAADLAALGAASIKLMREVVEHQEVQGACAYAGWFTLI
jgi:hypothetical protein